jgi:hypothetical protein
MIEQLKDLEAGTTLFLGEDAAEVIGVDQTNVVSVEMCATDDGEFTIVELENQYLVAHDFDTEPKYYIYQILDSGNAKELENDGYFFLNDERDFRSKIVCKDDVSGHTYTHSEIGAIYDIDSCEISAICEYTSKTHEMSHILIIKKEDEMLLILQGIEVSEDDIAVDD